MSISFLAIAQQSYCQVVSEAEAVNLALANYPSLKIAELRIAGQRSLQKTAFNPSQPSIVFESPTDVGLGYEVEQEKVFLFRVLQDPMSTVSTPMLLLTPSSTRAPGALTIL